MNRFPWGLFILWLLCLIGAIAGIVYLRHHP